MGRLCFLRQEMLYLLSLFSLSVLLFPVTLCSNVSCVGNWGFAKWDAGPYTAGAQHMQVLTSSEKVVRALVGIMKANIVSESG